MQLLCVTAILSSSILRFTPSTSSRASSLPRQRFWRRNWSRRPLLSHSAAALPRASCSKLPTRSSPNCCCCFTTATALAPAHEPWSATREDPESHKSQIVHAESIHGSPRTTWGSSKPAEHYKTLPLRCSRSSWRHTGLISPPFKISSKPNNNNNNNQWMSNKQSSMHVVEEIVWLATLCKLVVPCSASSSSSSSSFIKPASAFHGF